MQQTESMPQLRTEAQPALRPARRLASVHTLAPQAVPGQRGDNWLLGILLVLACVFAVSFVTRVLEPPSTRATSTTSSTWSGEGP